MAWYRCIGGNSGGGGGSFSPQFSRTLIADNTAQDTTITFTDDYTSYDFLEFEMFNPSSNVTTFILTTPEIIIHCMQNANDCVNFNEFHNSQYVCYKQENLNTWSRFGFRNCVVVKITGLKCTNATVNKTWIYQRSGRGTSMEAISSSNLLSYDVIFFSGSSSNYDEVQPCVFYANLNALLSKTPSVCYTFNIYSGYYLVTITDTEISSSRYQGVQGIKFIT